MNQVAAEPRRVLARVGGEVGGTGDDVAALDDHLDPTAVAAVAGSPSTVRWQRPAASRRQPGQRHREHEAASMSTCGQRRRQPRHPDLLAAAGGGERDDALPGPVGDRVGGAGAIRGAASTSPAIRMLESRRSRAG